MMTFHSIARTLSFIALKTSPKDPVPIFSPSFQFPSLIQVLFFTRLRSPAALARMDKLLVVLVQSLR
jgi:hypothetical protein